MALKYFGLGVNSIVVTTQSYKRYNIEGHADSHSVVCTVRTLISCTWNYSLHPKQNTRLKEECISKKYPQFIFACIP